MWYIMFWILIVLEILAGIFLAIYRFNEKMQSDEVVHNFVIKVSGKKRILDTTTPFWITIILTLFFNMSLLYGIKIGSLSSVSFFGANINIEPPIVIALSLGYTIITFNLCLGLQRSFLHALFSPIFVDAMEAISKEYFILQAFVVELYKQITDEPNFISALQGSEEGGFEHFLGLLKNIQSDNGVKISNYLYELLLTKSLSQKPSCVYSVWDTRIVKLEYWCKYTEQLDKVYKHIKKQDKKNSCFYY